MTVRPERYTEPLCLLDDALRRCEHHLHLIVPTSSQRNMNGGLGELLLLAAVSALRFGIALVFGYAVAGVVVAALFSASSTLTLRFALRH
jgi:hypothetical protein